MIPVSAISEYVYCPFKVYLRYVEGYELENPAIIAGRINHELARGYEELVKRNLWILEPEMSLEEIENVLFTDMPQLVQRIVCRYYNHDSMENSEYEKTCSHLEENLRLDSVITSIKAREILRSGKSSSEMVDMLFNPSISEFLLKSNELNLKGKVDKIELGEGTYHPVEIKSGLPPVNGVWESESLQIAAYSVLIEEEFKKEVQIGFVEYLKIRERKAVVINSKLKDKLFEVLNSINHVLYDCSPPPMTQKPNKCRKCSYSPICERC